MKIKQNLISENRFQNYLIYAVGEFILIVIGILVAIQINIWNESRKDRILEKSYITRILNDIQKDQSKLQEVIDYQQIKIVNNLAFQGVISQLNPQNQLVADSLFVLALKANNTFYPVIGSYQSTLSNGGIRIFNNDSLFSLIINLYDSHYMRLKYNGEALDEKYFYLTQKYRHQRRINGLGELSKIDTADFLDDFDYFQKSQKFYVERCIETLVIIDEILAVKL